VWCNGGVATLPRYHIGFYMKTEQVKEWLLEKLEGQIEKAQIAMDNVIHHLHNRDWKSAGEEHRSIDYWLSRCKNTQRLIDEIEEC